MLPSVFAVVTSLQICIPRRHISEDHYVTYPTASNSLYLLLIYKSSSCKISVARILLILTIAINT